MSYESNAINEMTTLVDSTLARLVEQLALMNRILSNIEEALRGIEQRLSYANVLDNQD